MGARRELAGQMYADDEIEWAERFVTEGARQVDDQFQLVSALQAGDQDFHIETRVLRTLEAMQASNIAYRDELKSVY